jgi:hypothetical protein
MQTSSSSQNVQNGEDSDGGEEDDDMVPPLAPDNDSDSDEDSDDGKDNNASRNLDWIPYIIKDFQAGQSFSSTRSSSSSNNSSSDSIDIAPTTEDFLPKFKKYNHQGGSFQGANKKAIRDAECKSVSSFFLLYITHAILTTFVIAINAWSRLNHLRWNKDLDVAEFKAFIAIILELGLIKYPTREIAFEDSPHGNAFIMSIMTKKRFDDIIKCWRYEDYSKTTPEQRKELKVGNPFWAVKTLVKLVATSFKVLFHPYQLLDIDEQCIPWKGRHSCRCYNPNKPEKWHFKVFALNCALTGYMCDFYLYEGASETRDEDVRATTQPILKLFCENPTFQNRNHVLITDNWYTGMENLWHVSNTGNHYMGTVRTNKKGLPSKEHLFAKVGKNKKQRGDMMQMETTKEDKKAYFIAWQDNKPVHMLSTVEAYKSDCTRCVKTPTGWNPNEKINRPSTVAIYNKGMGGTDGFDQRLAYYRPNVKATASWYPRVFVHIIIACAVNSFILYVDYNNLGKDYTYLMFLRSLIDELAEDQLSKNRNETAPANMSSKKNFYTHWCKDETRFRGNHFPLTVREARQEGEKNRFLKRGRCVVCDLKCHVSCEQCGVYLCDEVHKDREINCFKAFHTVKKYRDTNPTL